MKIKDIKHINETIEDDEGTLVFYKCVDGDTGELAVANNQPDDWDNVRLLSENLYYAWDEIEPTDGCVYLGGKKK